MASHDPRRRNLGRVNATNWACGHRMERCGRGDRERTREIARQSGLEFLEREPDQSADLDGAVSELLEMSNAIAEMLDDWIQESDLDAVSRLQALVYGNMSVADAITAASEEPAYLAASLRIDHATDFPAASWELDIQSAEAGLRGAPLVMGGATEVQIRLLEDALGDLSDSAGGELYGITTDTAVVLALPQFGGVVARVVAGKAGSLVHEASKWIRGAFSAAKRVASKVVAWVVDKAYRIFPRTLLSGIEATIHQVVTAVNNVVIPNYVGVLAADILGKQDVIQAWKDADQGAADSGVHVSMRLQSSSCATLRSSRSVEALWIVGYEDCLASLASIHLWPWG